jgi:hypothetical protein
MVGCLSGNIAIAGDQAKAAAPTSSDAHANGAINWQMVEHGSPIPHQMPVADADTAIQAGFAPQWIARSIKPWPPSVQDPDLPAKRVLQIAKADRRPDDRWAHEAADKLRATIRTNGNADILKYARVFCGSEGCLCYFETTADASSFEAYERVRSDLLHGLLDDGGWGRALDIKPGNVNEVGETGIWELIYILRTKSRG